MGTRLAAVGMAAAIGLGGLGVAALNPLTVAGAQNASTATTAPASTGTASHDGPLKRALQKLVADGTLTQEQADKVLATTKAEAQAAKDQRKEKGKANRQELLKVVADAIGTTPAKVTEGLKGGTSIAEQAKAAGVDRQVVDDAVTKVLTARIDAAVQDGKLTDEQATKAKARLDKVVDRILDADGSHRGGGALRDRLRQHRGN